MRVEIRKLHAAGRAYLVVNQTWARIDELAGCARDLCRRRTGLDADGLVYLRHAGNARFDLRVVDAAGRPVPLDGNALQCAARSVRLDYGYTEMTLRQNGSACPVRLGPDLVQVGLPVDPVDGGRRTRVGDSVWTVLGQRPEQVTPLGNVCWATEVTPSRLTLATRGPGRPSSVTAAAAVVAGLSAGQRLADPVRVSAGGGRLTVGHGSGFWVEGAVHLVFAGECEWSCGPAA